MKVSRIETKWWDSEEAEQLCACNNPMIWPVMDYFTCSSKANVSGILEVTRKDKRDLAYMFDERPEAIDAALHVLAGIGWCEYKDDILWVKGRGGVVDQLGADNWADQPKWRGAALKHLNKLPQLPLVKAFRDYWDLPAEKATKVVDIAERNCVQ